jgi:hypothetical protein
MLLALHRQATRSHRPSIAGTAMPLAAAPYRASGLVHWRKAVIAAYDALMNGNSNQSRFHIAPGTSSVRRPALKLYEPQKWKPKTPRVWQASHV